MGLARSQVKIWTVRRIVLQRPTEKTLGMFTSTYHGLRYIFDGMLTKERGGLSAKPCMCRLRQLTDDPY